MCIYMHTHIDVYTHKYKWHALYCLCVYVPYQWNTLRIEESTCGLYETSLVLLTCYLGLNIFYVAYVNGRKY